MLTQCRPGRFAAQNLRAAAASEDAAALVTRPGWAWAAHDAHQFPYRRCGKPGRPRGRCLRAYRLSLAGDPNTAQTSTSLVGRYTDSG